MSADRQKEQMPNTPAEGSPRVAEARVELDMAIVGFLDAMGAVTAGQRVRATIDALIAAVRAESAQEREHQAVAYRELSAMFDRLCESCDRSLASSPAQEKP